MVKALVRPEKEGFVLVTFFHGTGAATQERYTDSDLPFAGFTVEPRMSLQIPSNEGTFDKRELRIVLPTDPFTTRASSGVPHSPIFVIVEEVTRGLFTGDQNTQKTLYRGRCVRTIKNYQGRANKVAFFCLPQKARLDVQMGLPANHHCAWTLFKGGCGVVQSSFELITEITSVDGAEVTIIDGPVQAPAVGDPRYWKRGYMEKDGLRMAIRDYDGDTDDEVFFMARPVPSDWVGGSNDILIVPGCDKTIEVCRSRYSAEEFFEGLGFAIPAYQPNIENPGDTC